MELHVGTSAFQILMQAHFVSEFPFLQLELQNIKTVLY